MPAGAYHDPRVGLGGAGIERHDPLGEQRNHLFIEGRSERFAPFAGRQARKAKQELHGFGSHGTISVPWVVCHEGT